MKIKICGLTRIEDIRAVNEALPDYIGFVFAKSRRRVTPGEARRLRAALDPGIRTVGVFADSLPEEIQALCREGTIDLVQLHGGESAAYAAALRGAVSVPVIRAVRVQSTEQIVQAEKTPCDYLLLDAYHAAARGGTGRAFDHTLIPPLTKPYFLAGGIDLETVPAAAKTGAYCLDVSSGAESGGVKDRIKIRQLVEIARRY